MLQWDLGAWHISCLLKPPVSLYSSPLTFSLFLDQYKEAMNANDGVILSAHSIKP